MHYTGIVQQGARRGAELGYPTANIPLTEESVSGVYVAHVLVGDQDYQAAAFADPARGILEAHLLDFSGDLYGRHIVVELCEKLRDGTAFADDETLRRAIADDIVAARAYFAKVR